MSKIFYLLSFIFCSFLFLSACKSTEPIPSYIQIQPFQFLQNTRDSVTTNIRHAWVFLGGDFLGAYTLPASVPVLKEGTQPLKIFGGIDKDGIATTPDMYPLYAEHTQNVTLNIGKTTTIIPKIQYINTVKTIFSENFEAGNNFSEDIDADKTTNLRRAETTILYGKQCGNIQLDENHPLSQVAAVTPLQGLQADKEIYLEMDYLTEANLGVGVTGLDASGMRVNYFFLYLRPNIAKNKVYIALSKKLITVNLQQAQLMFSAELPKENGSFTKTKASVWLDNVKILTN
jgi:hypothetical protein